MKTHEIKKFRKTYKKYDKDCVFDGYKLAVLYDEKDDVKKYGGRWDDPNQHWWMPKNKLLDQVHDNGTLVRDWLNDNHMIMGQYGEVQESGEVEQRGHPKMYTLSNDRESHMVQVAWYEDHDAVRFNGIEHRTDTQWLPVDKARELWNKMVQGNYHRMHGTHPENV